jgi:hypothetical protein
MEMNQNSKDAIWETLSFRTTYLISIGLIIVFALYTYVVYGIGWIDIFPQGTWLILGGFSLFYPTSGFQVLCGIVLLIQMIGSAKSLHITANDDQINVQERYKIGFKSSFAVKRSSIARISMETGGPGKKIWWALVWGLHIAYILTDGVFLATNPFVFGYGISNAWLYIVTALIDLVILILILWSNELILAIETTTNLYHLTITADAGTLTEVLGMKSENTTLQSKNQTFLSLGILFLAISILTRWFNVMYGTPVRLMIFLLGMLLVILGWKHPIIRNTVINSSEVIAKKNRFTGYSLLWILSVILLVTVGMTLGAWFRFLPQIEVLIGYTILSISCSFGLIGGIYALLHDTKHKNPRTLLTQVGLFVLGFVIGLVF